MPKKTAVSLAPDYDVHDTFSNTVIPEKELRHLLKRTLLGVSFSDIDHFHQSTLSTITEKLLSFSAPKTFPLKDYSAINSSNPDAKIAIGDTWATDVNFDPVINFKRKISLKNWLIGLFYSHNRSLKPTMTLFWHTIFVIQTKKITLSNHSFIYFDSLFNHSLDNFQTLFLNQVTNLPLLEYHRKLKKTSKDLHKSYIHYILSNYLFGADCSKYISKTRINRFARMVYDCSILQENVLQAQKTKNHSSYPNDFYQTDHGNLSITAHKNSITDLSSELISFTNKLLQHEIIASTLSTRMFKWFVSQEIDLYSYTHFINPLSEMLINSEYNIKSTLQSLFHNEHFYNTKYIGCLVKSPIEFLFGLSKEFQLADVKNRNDIRNYPFWESIQVKSESLEQSLGDPPHASGWPAYNSPPYQQLWITDENINRRTSMARHFIDCHLDFDNKIIQNDMLKIFRNLPDSSNLIVFIDSILNQFFQIRLSHQNKIVLKNFISTKYHLSEDDWKYMLYSLKDKTASGSMKSQMLSIVKDLLSHLVSLPEYQRY